MTNYPLFNNLKKYKPDICKTWVNKCKHYTNWPQNKVTATLAKHKNLVLQGS